MSNIQGTVAVGSMVVFVNGRPEPREYRRFRIRSGDTPDDFRMMAEVLRRRFQRASRLRAETGALSLAAVGADRGAGGARRRRAAGPEPDAGRDRRRARPTAARRDAGWALPDLVIVDGGKGQLSAAVGVMRELTLGDVPLAGLAKRFEELYLPGRSGADRAARARARALYLVQRIRDEAHRFAITYHRNVRGKRALAASSTRWRASVRRARRRSSSASGSVRRIREASVDERGRRRPASAATLAERLKAHLAREGMLA